MTAPHAFLIDDDEDYGLLLKHELLEMKIISKVTFFKSGEEALVYFVKLIDGKRPAAEFPHLIILDLYLKGESGLEILHRLKNCDRTKNIPVIINTASDDKGDLVEVYKKGGAVFVQKQANNEFLCRVLNQLKLTDRI